MSIRGWSSGVGDSVVGLIYMMMFVFAILLGIVQGGGFRWNVSSVIGVWIVIGSTYTWIISLRYKLKHIHPQ